MDRHDWLREKRREAEHGYDSVLAATYDEHDSPISSVHGRFVAELIAGRPVDATVLDAPCGIGKYFAMVREQGPQSRRL